MLDRTAELTSGALLTRHGKKRMRPVWWIILFGILGGLTIRE
jgi:hypothetical protein